MLKELSPLSILVGALVSLAALGLLSPVDSYGTAVLLVAFCLGAGACELIRRLRSKPAPPTAPRKARRP